MGRKLKNHRLHLLLAACLAVPNPTHAFPNPTEEDETARSATASQDESPFLCQCGVKGRSRLAGNVPSDKIVGGINAAWGEFPWQVGLLFKGYEKPFCGGSLLSSRTVITAAHCHQRNVSTFDVVLGERDLFNPNDGQTIISPISFVRHPLYNGEAQQDYDFAIITLSRDAGFSKRISPICLPTGETALEENRPAIISGWGTLSSGGIQPNILQKAFIRTMSNEACTTDTQYTSTQITPRMICAGGWHKDSCQGDSGGPMVVKDRTRSYYELVGVTSWGIGCAQRTAPGVYARVSAGKAWIADNIRGTVCFPPLI